MGDHCKKYVSGGGIVRAALETIVRVAGEGVMKAAGEKLWQCVNGW